GPLAMSWPEALELLSAEVGKTITFQVATERELLARLASAGIAAGGGPPPAPPGGGGPARGKAPTHQPLPHILAPPPPPPPHARSPSSFTTTARNSPDASDTARGEWCGRTTARGSAHRVLSTAAFRCTWPARPEAS